MDYPLEVLAANQSLGRLEAVSFWPHMGGPFISSQAAGRTVSFAAPEESQTGEPLPERHRRRQLPGAGESGLLGRLEVLDLDMGRISDDGARLLAGCPELRRLKRLVLTNNQLSPAGIAVLQATGVPLEPGHQFDADAIASYAYLQGGDME
jgi:hypothetical protein